MELVRKPGSKDGWYSVTPADAQRFLQEQPRNRVLNETRSRRLSEVVTAGLWAQNGETTVFDEKGLLMDGQHRMRACVLANKPIVTYCVFNIPRRFFATFDDGAKRTGNDALVIAGHKYTKLSSGIARYLHLYEAGRLSEAGGVATNKTQVDIVKHNTDIPDVAAKVTLMKGLKDVCKLGDIGFVYLLAARIDKDKADEFVSKLASGAGLRNDDPVLLLRNRFISLRGEKGRITSSAKLALIVKAWTMHREGRKAGSLLKGSLERSALDAAFTI